MNSEEEFEWPCDREYAHGPHSLREPRTLSTQDIGLDCPGVKAHPNTMIGKGSG